MADLFCTAGEIAIADIIDGVNERIDETDISAQTMLGALSVPAAGTGTNVIQSDEINTRIAAHDTNLGATHNALTVVVTSSTGTDATINAATATTAGIMSEAIYDEHVVNNGKVSNVSTNLSKTTAVNQITINSSDGDNVIVGEATGTIAGVMSTTHHDKLDGIATSANNYSHPTHTARTEGQDTGVLSGAYVISDLDFNISSDTLGHVTACDFTTLSTRQLTPGDIGAATSAHEHTSYDYSAADLSGATVFDDIDVTNGIVTAVATRELTPGDIGAAALAGATMTGLMAYDDTAFTTEIDCALGNSFSKTVTANFTQTFANVPTIGNACVLVVKLYDGGDYTITWATSIEWEGGSAPTLTSNGTDIVTLYTIDGGTTWFGTARVAYS